MTLIFLYKRAVYVDEKYQEVEKDGKNYIGSYNCEKREKWIFYFNIYLVKLNFWILK
nr:hypothetical protein BAR15_180142 [Bartonella sp. AR 15-3]